MKSCIALALGLAGLASSVPTPADRVIYDWPYIWRFEVKNAEGPGCPDFANPPTDDSFTTRATYGITTGDDPELNYWFIAYPSLRASVNETVKEAHTWCETTVQYTEIEKDTGDVPQSDFRLKVHVNGTRMLSSYDLDEGVTAKWKFAYHPDGGDDIVDEIVVNGPLEPDPNNVGTEIVSPPDTTDRRQYKLPECGSGLIKYRTDLYLTSKNGASGDVYTSSKKVGLPRNNYGAQQAISFDFERCGK